MLEPATTQEFWVGTIVDWIIKNTSIRRERLDLQRKFTQEPYNMSVVGVLNMMDDLVAIYKDVNKKDLVLTQNWRLAHRVDRVADFITAFLEVVEPQGVARAAAPAPAPAKAIAAAPPSAVPMTTSTATSAPVSENRHGAMHNARLEALRANPGGDWTAADLEITASQYAMKFRKATGTHVVFLHPSVPNCVTVPLKNKIRPPHIRAFVAMIDRMEELDR